MINSFVTHMSFPLFTFLTPALLLISIALSWNTFMLMFDPEEAKGTTTLLTVNVAASIALSASGLLFVTCGVWIGSGLFVAALGIATSLQRYRAPVALVSISAAFFCLYLIEVS